MDVESPSDEKKTNPMPIFSESQIRDLATNEQRISRLLHLAGLTIAALHPKESESVKTDQAQGTTLSSHQILHGWDLATVEKAKGVVDSYSAEYFSTLNNVQISLRTAIAQLRARRISLLPLLTTNSTIIGTGSSIGPGGIRLLEGDNFKDPRHSSPELGLSATVLEREAWRDIVRSLTALRDTE